MNVSEFENVSDATDSMISALQAFGYAAEDSLHLVDIFNSIGNNFAISTSDLASSLTKSASALVTAGVGIEQSAALLTGANTIMQDPDSVSQGLKIIALRIRGVKTELEAMGEETDSVLNTAKLQEKIKGLTGVDIVGDDGGFRNIYDILMDIADVWEDLDSMSQAAVVEAMAGKNRANVFTSLMVQAETIKEAYDVAMDSEGSAMAENEKYLNSIEGRIDQFTNSLQTMWMNAMNTDAVKGFVDAGTLLVRLFDEINQHNPIGIFGSLAIIGGTLFGAWKGIPALWTAVSAASKGKIAAITTEIAAINALNAAQASGVASESALTAAKTANATVTGANLATMLAETNATLTDTAIDWLAANAEEELTKQKILGAVASGTLTQAEGVAMLATSGLAGSFEVATTAAKAFMLALLKNPLTWIAVGIAAVAAKVIYLNGAFDRAKDKLSETSKELSETQDEIKSINNELKTTKERIDELNSKDKLSFTEKEELENLKAQNKELERKLKLEEQNEKIQKNQRAIDALNAFNLDDSFKTRTTTVMTDDGYGTEVQVAPEMDRLLEDRRKNVELLEAAIKDLEDAQTKALANPEDTTAQDVYANALENVQKYEQAVATSESNIMSLIKEREELYGNVGYFEGDETTLSVFQKKWNEALDQINLDNYQAQIAFDTTGKVAQDALEWAADRAGFTAEEIRTAFASGNFTGFEELIQMFIDLGIIPNDSLDSIQIVVDMLNEADKAANSAAKALDNYKNSLPNIVGQLSQFEEGLSDLSGAYNEFVENGVASAKSLEGLKEVFGAEEMADEYEEFVRIIGDSSSTITEVQNAIEGIAGSYLNTLDLVAGVAEEDINIIASQLEQLGVKNAKEFIQTKIDVYEEVKDVYNFDMKNFGSAEDAKNAYLSDILGERFGINGDLINDLADQYDIDLTNFTGTEREKVEKAKEAAKLIAQAHAAAERAKVIDSYADEVAANPDDIRLESRAINKANSVYQSALASKEGEILAVIDSLELSAHNSATKRIEDYFNNPDFDFGKFDDLGGSGSGSGKDSLTDFDWIEHYFDSIDAQIEAAEARLGKTLDDVAHIGARNDVINGIITLYKRKLPDIDKIIKAYEARANALYSSFSGDIQAKIKNGSLDLSELDNDLASRIQEYFDYVGEASNWKIELDNIKVEISEKALERFNNVMDAYDNEISISASANDLIESQIDLLEEQGERISKVYYESMIANTNNQLALMEKQRSAMIAELNKALANDEIKKGSSQWFEMVAAISDVEANIYDATISIESFNNAIRDLHWQEFDRIVESISNIAEESANLRELLGEDSDMVDELGEWTAQGVASLGLLAQEMENAEYRAKLYADEIAYLDKEYKKGNYSQDEYNEKLQELKDGQWDSIKAYEDAKDAIIDLNKVRVDAIKDGIQKEIDAYEELIEKQKESLQAKKDEHDWANTLKDHTDEIDSIQRQIDALAGDSSASAAAKRKQLEEELAKANEELNEAYYDREIEIAQETLDKELELYRENKESEMEAWDEYLTHEEKVLQDSFNSVKANAELIHSTILETAKTYGISITSNITDPWKKGQNAIASYSTAFDGATSHYMTQLGIVKLELQNLQKEADLTAQALANALMQDLNMPSLEIGGIENLNDALSNGSITTGSKNYTVKNGDTLWDIAEEYLGDATRWKEIYEANKDKINDPNLIYVGQNLVIPGVQVSNSYKPKGSSSSSNADKAGMSDADKAALEAAGKAWNNAKTQAEKDAAHAAAEAIRDKYGYSGGSDGSEYIKKKYAKGTTGVKSDELAWIDEHGLEEIVMHAQGGKLAYLTKGSSVIPHDISENLIELGKVDPHTWMDKNRPNTTPANIVAQNNNFELKFGSLINIEHADKDSIPEIKAAVQKQLDSYMKNLNSGIKKYAR